MTRAEQQLERWNVRARDGAHLALEACGCGPALLLLPGTSADGSRWHRFMRRVAGSFTAVALHRRGRSGSEDGDGPYSVELEAEDVASVAATLPEPLIVVAHSFGALAALQAAPMLPNLAGLVLYEPPLSRQPRPVPPIAGRLEALIAASQPDQALTAFLTEHVGLPRVALERLRSDAAWSKRAAAVHTVAREVRAACQYRLEPRRFTALTTRVLLLEGSESPAPLRGAVALLRDVLPHSRVHTFERQGHFAMDGDFEQFSAMMDDFLRGARAGMTTLQTSVAPFRVVTSSEG